MSRTLTLAAALIGLYAAAASAAPSIQPYLSTGLHTLQMHSDVVQKDDAELKKIGRDFAYAYRLSNLTVSYEQPGKLHFETNILGRRIYYTISGDKKLTEAPFHHVVEDISHAPGKRQTLMDLGLISPEMMIQDRAKFLRRDQGLLVFEISPKQIGETFKDIVWIDPKTHITARRENYDRDGHLTKWFLYQNPVQAAPGLWIPTRVAVYNTDNRLGGVTGYTRIQVNRPIHESLFQIE